MRVHLHGNLGCLSFPSTAFTADDQALVTCIIAQGFVSLRYCQENMGTELQVVSIIRTCVLFHEPVRVQRHLQGKMEYLYNAC